MTAIRRIKTAEQLDAAFEGVLRFIASARSERERRQQQLGTAACVGKPDVHGTKKKVTATARTAKTVGTAAGCNPTDTEHGHRVCSMLAAAFSRRADSLVASHVAPGAVKAAGDIDILMDLDGRGGMLGGAAVGDRATRAQQRRALLAHLKACMEQLTVALDTLTAQREATEGVSGARPSADADAMLTYGIGEARDFAVHQRIRAVERLRGLTATLSSSRWNVEFIVDAVWEISDFSERQSVFGAASSSAAPGVAALEATRVVTPLRDPLSHALIRLPCRGDRCTHLELFDATSFVRAAQRRAVTHPISMHEPGAACPLCRAFIPLHSLHVDSAALAAMRAYAGAEPGLAGRRAVAEAVPPGKTVGDAATAPPHRLSSNHCLEWNMVVGCCQVIEGKLSDLSSAELDGDDGAEDEEGRDADGNATAGTARAPGEAGLRKRRRVEIGGHVLFVDE